MRATVRRDAAPKRPAPVVARGLLERTRDLAGERADEHGGRGHVAVVAVVVVVVVVAVAIVAGRGGPVAPGIEVTLAEVGLEAEALDRTADPCVDFYQFACGGWLRQHPIPADRARWSRFAELEERNQDALQALLEQAAHGGAGDAASTQLGDYYAACMDETAIEAAGTAPIRPLLARTLKVKDARSWLAAVIELHKLGVWVVWREHAQADLKDSLTNVTYLDVAGLGLPDRDYYVTPALADPLAAYQRHVGAMLGLAGVPAGKTAAAAADVVAIETELATLTRTGVEKRALDALYNPMDRAQLAAQVKSVDWPAYWKAMGYAPSKKLIVGTPRFFAALDKLRARFTPAQWSSYLTYHLVQATAFALPRAFDAQAFELERVLTGVERRRPRGKRCLEATAEALGELLGQRYVARHVPAGTRQAATMLVDALVTTMGQELARLDWMAAATKQLARDKLARIVRMIGYPDRWRTYAFEVRRADFAGNRLRAAAFETRRVLARSGTPVDRGEWQLNAFAVNAYYDPTANAKALPAGILQPPFFGSERAIAANLGGIGMVIGHELTHGFDDQGARFDADGNLVNWWQPQDAERFEARGTCVADQYATFEATPKGFVNGRLTLGENIADLGGVKMAFNTYRGLRKQAARRYVADGFTEDQQFFIAVGQAWCGQDRPAEIQRRLTVDVHAPPKFRVYGALRNLPDFAEVFQCAPGTPMSPARICSVW